MSGLSAVIARIGDIENQITSLDAASRAAKASATEKPDAGAVGATTFAEALEAAKSVTAPAEAAASASSAGNPDAAGKSGAELVSALQTLFTANASASGDSAAQVKKILESLG